MDYKSAYLRLISKHGSESKPSGVYTERHRVIPGCLGGRYTKENSRHLSPRAHYVAHLMLARIHGGTTWAAVRLMGDNLDRTSSRLYAAARERHAENVRANNPMNMSGVRAKHSATMSTPEHRAKIGRKKEAHPRWGAKLTEETKEKIRIQNTGKRPWLGKKHTAETKKKISANHGTKDPDVCKKISESRKGQKPSLETREKMSASAKGRPRSEETKARNSAAAKRMWAKRKEHHASV